MFNNISYEALTGYFKAKGLSDTSVVKYKTYFNKFNYPVFNQSSVNDFLSFDTNRNSVAKSFIANLKSYLLLNYKELGLSVEAKGYINEVVIPKLTGRVKERLPDYLTEEEIKLLENNLKEEKYKIMLDLSFNCGLRMGELLKIRVDDFKFKEYAKSPEELENNVLNALYGHLTVLGKGNKQGLAVVPARLMKRVFYYIRENIIEIKNNSELVFIKKGRFKQDARLYQLRLREAGINAGITKKDENGEYIKSTFVHPHRLRHSLGNKLIKNDVDIKIIQKMLRHSTISSTQIYTSLSQKDIDEKVKGII